MQRVCGGRAEFVLLSLWESMEAMRKFSRGEIENEVPYPADKDFLLEFNSQVNYVDVFDQPHFMKYCAFYDPAIKKFKGCPHHNESD